ncbi:hypothetical protein C1752_07903 [Acaryochloris thomasi RCC1774]|uniref:Uncharacterized protein n=1 Tax=Acaryochloris thomasi RCC1774 TaxID=1764569 RepID=A0A2W1JHX5_9CYAN|nr:hypothetical protein C1752_07903 [Acaryochloris thomasi RCC1774]
MHVFCPFDGVACIVIKLLALVLIVLLWWMYQSPTVA